MLKPVFKRSDFILCEVPAPTGYPQSQTHCEVIVHNGCYYLSSSPYPVEMSSFLRGIRKGLRILSGGRLGAFVHGELFENPCLYYASTDGSEYPNSFLPFANNPIIGRPESSENVIACNSDPQIFSDNSRLFLFNRVLNRCKVGEIGTKYYSDIYRVEIFPEGASQKVGVPELFRKTNNVFVSPSIIYWKGYYYLMYLDTNSYNDGVTFNGMFFYRSECLDGLRSTDSHCRVKVVCDDELIPWHFSLFQHDGKMYAIVACVEKGRKNYCKQMLGGFNSDISELTLQKRPLTTMNSYRGCALVLKDETFLLYTTTVNEMIKGSKSVDGRNIMLAKMNFSDLLRCVSK